MAICPRTMRNGQPGDIGSRIFDRGEVTIGASSSIGFGAVLTAESGPITVGSSCVIMDCAETNPVRIGDNVLVGPRAYLTGCEVEDTLFSRPERYERR